MGRREEEGAKPESARQYCYADSNRRSLVHEPFLLVSARALHEAHEVCRCSVHHLFEARVVLSM